MNLNEKTRLSDLLKAYPFLLDFLVGISPEYQKLKNPLLRKTVGRFADLKQVAEMGKIPLSELVEKISAEIKKHNQDLTAAPSGKTAGDLNHQKRDERKRIERIEILKQIIRDLHRGGDVNELKNRFAALIKEVSPEEIARLEQQVIEEGLPEEEVKKLCDLHIKIFEESLEAQKAPDTIPGHPVHTLMSENRVAEKLLEEIKLILERLQRETAELETESNFGELADLLTNLAEIDKHYLKKENQLFPLLEARGVEGPTKVMWAIHDDIRKELKELRRMVGQKDYSVERMQEILTRGSQLIRMIQDMIYKEEKILYPMSLEVLTEADWARVKLGEEEIGYAWIQPGSEWKPEVTPIEVSAQSQTKAQAQAQAKSVYAKYAEPATGVSAGGLAEETEYSSSQYSDAPYSSPQTAQPSLGAAAVLSGAPARKVETILNLSAGQLTADQINLLLTHLPIDISFVDENDTVIYYSDTPDRIFPRSPGVIGRKVQNCHPPKSVHIVNRILEAFKKGEKNVAEFWIELQGRFIHIRYFAVRDAEGHYRGCLEVSQDVTGIRALQGQKRLLDWE